VHLLLLDPNQSRNERFELRLDLISQILQIIHGDEVDLVVLNEASPLLAYEVIRGGKVLFCRNDMAKTQYEATTINRYLDWRPFSRIYQNYLFEDIRKGRPPLINREIIEIRLAKLREYCEHLKELRESDRETFKKDYKVHGLAEHFLYLSIQSMLDIGHHLVAGLQLRKPLDYEEVFQILGEARILPEELIRALAGVGRIRNILAHAYITIDLDKVHENLQKAPEQIGEFMRLVQRFIEEQGS
jgi:uncharacterized protein YutE (UPF0331/DUF86 family)